MGEFETGILARCDAREWVREFDGHRSNRVAVGTSKGRVDVWDATAKTLLGTASTGSAVRSLKFHPNGDTRTE